MFHMEDDDLLFGHVDSVDDMIPSMSISEQALKNSLKGCSQARGILDKVGLCPFDNPGTVLLVDPLEIPEDFLMPDDFITQVFSPAPQWSDIWRSYRSASRERDELLRNLVAERGKSCQNSQWAREHPPGDEPKKKLLCLDTR